MNKITMSLQFAGVILPIAHDEQGLEVVPLKPIVELFGLKWEKQRLKVQGDPATCTPPRGGAGATSTPPRGGADTQESAYWARRLGTCNVTLPYAGQQRQMVCIRLDRVTAFLNSINPIQVMISGNESGADFLERKQEEWDDVLHAYEQAGGMFKHSAHTEQRLRLQGVRTLIALNREKRATQDATDRQALEQIARILSSDLGLPHQVDLLDKANEKTG